LARSCRGLVFGFTGRPEEGVEEGRLALRLSPRDWYRFLFLHDLACCHYAARDYPATVEAAAKVVALNPDYFYGHQLHAMSCAQLGQTERANKALKEALRVTPNLVDALKNQPLKEPADFEHLWDGLRKAGLEI